MSEELTTTEVMPSLSKPETLKAFSVELKNFIVSQKLYTPIQGKNYVNVEGWQFAGASMGLVAVVKNCEKQERDGEFSYFTKAGKEVVTKEIAYKAWVDVYSGERLVSSGFAICSNKESKKNTFDEYAVASMAQTRAVGKAYRLLLGFLMKMAGYEGTPTEEREGIEYEQPERGTDIPSYCIDCGKEMVPYVKGEKKGQLHCKGKGAPMGQKPSCPPREMLENDKDILKELNGIPNL